MDLFLGSICPGFLQDELVKRNQYVDFPGQNFQHALLNGLMSHNDSLRIITSPVIRSKRKAVKDICHKTFFSYSEKQTNEDIYVGTTPIGGLQRLMEFFRVYSSLKTILTKEKGVLIIYALHTPFLLSAVLLRKNITCSCVIVPDLPEYMYNKPSTFRRVAKWLDRKIINWCAKKIDGYVLLSPYMREKLPIEGKPWTLVEGVYNEEITPKKHEEHKNEKVILYTGNLSAKTGIKDLLEGFKLIESKNYRLWIRGNGETKKDVLIAEKDDPRIKYFEPMPIEELRQLQKQATVLVNPVRPSNEFTKYFFPSKTMEYLASGTPTIMYKLQCLPEDYYPHIYFVETENVESLKNKIIEVCEKQQPELDEFGESASEFIRTKKNAFVQAGKIYDLIKSIIRGN